MHFCQVKRFIINYEYNRLFSLINPIYNNEILYVGQLGIAAISISILIKYPLRIWKIQEILYFYTVRFVIISASKNG